MGCGSSRGEEGRDERRRTLRESYSRSHADDHEPEGDDDDDVVTVTFDTHDVHAFEAQHNAATAHDEERRRSNEERTRREEFARAQHRTELDRQRDRDYAAFEEEQRAERERINAEARRREGSGPDVLTL